MDGEDLANNDREEITHEENEIAHEEFLEQNDSDEFLDEFGCSVCLLVAVQPTSLTCGHTFCRICLAKWYLTSKKKQCPLCGQAYQGHPQINIHIKNMSARLYPKQMKEREKLLELSLEDKTILQRFDKEILNKRPDRKTVGAFCLGITLTLLVFTSAYLTWFWQFSDIHSFTAKPVQFWKPSDVKDWLDDLSWTTEYIHNDIKDNIDGNMLLAMDELSLLQHFNVSEPLYQKALLSAISKLKEQGVKMPSTLWEYTGLFPGRCLFLVYGLKEYPRFMILYTWMYFYDDLFLPIMKTAAKSTDTADDMNTSDWIKCLLYVLVSPHWLTFMVAYQMTSHDRLTLLIVVINAALNQILEIPWILFFFRNNNWEQRNIITSTMRYGLQLLLAFMTMITWPVIPQFVCDIIFYSVLYLRPGYVFLTLYRKWKQHNNPQWIAQ